MCFVRFVPKNFRENYLSRYDLVLFFTQKMEVYGHSLIVPNKHYENIFDIPEEELTHIIKFAQKISLHLKERLGTTGINILHASGKSAQQSVSHFHIHIFPRFDNDGLDTWPKLEKKNMIAMRS